jgi:hypothetical protein
MLKSASQSINGVLEMKRETFFLKAVVVLIGLAILAICIFGLPSIANEAADHYAKSVYVPILIGVYAAAIPFYAALYQALRLLSYIDRNKAFSELSIQAIRNIKWCAVAISILYAGCMPFIFQIAQDDDAPGLAALGLVVIGASLVIAVFAAVLQKLLQHAIDIKSENDLTI